ncbi:Trm112 family protein [Actinocorallia sp. API 0066]|uniref:Trm112 family protein n=1 Tax=Actinocorallia sp. API 0066 TaxID=2896846 RepID=UPI001E359BB5|nr:Trm112 family protein [Actinocorallia sp. API 0066]MCD0449285.1 Trm112 family protein [Actinocorallia sp. API 0066]
MKLDPALFDLLACPIDKQALLYLDDLWLFYNPRLRRAYHAEDGIPALLAQEGAPVTDENHDLYLRRAVEGNARVTLRASLAEVVQSAQRVP